MRCQRSIRQICSRVWVRIIDDEYFTLPSKVSKPVTCYFQGCSEKGITKEHVPPRSFFPDGEKVQLLTVKSCVTHNNAKSKDDLYVLAQICMNASPSNRAIEVFMNKVAPQLGFNNDALRKRLADGAVSLGNGAVKYKVDFTRLDDFFTALSCGIIYKSCGSSLPSNYEISHVFHNFQSETDVQLREIESSINALYAGNQWTLWSSARLIQRMKKFIQQQSSVFHNFNLASRLCTSFLVFSE